MDTQHTLLLQIEKLIQGGNGLARHDGRVVFIPFAIPGETVDGKVVREKKEYAEAEIERIVTPSPDRRIPRCPVFTRCGGCQLQHLPEEKQLQYKTQAMQEVLAKIGKIDKQTAYDLLPPVPSPLPFHYRVRAQMKVQRGKTGDHEIGYYQAKSHRIVPINHCPLLTPALNTTLEKIRERLPLDRLEAIELQGGTAGNLLVILHGDRYAVEKGERFFKAIQKELSIKGVVIYTGRGRFVFGEDYLIESIKGRQVRVGDRSFTQVNPAVNRLLIETVIDWMAPSLDDRILELYSGIGNFTLFLAEKSAEVMAVEENRFAVADAQWNLREAGMKNVFLQTASAETGIQTALKQKQDGRLDIKGDLKLFLDPPREGAGKKVMEGIASLTPRQVVYLSCNPATFSRDMMVLTERGYVLRRVQPFDLFPQTGHLELLAEVMKK